MWKGTLGLKPFLLAGALALVQSVAHPSHHPRINKIVALLDSGKPVFGIFAREKTPEGAVEAAAVEGADFVFYDMETGPFDVEGMRVFMQFMIDRGEVARSGSLANPSPLVTRIPPIRDGRAEARSRVQRILDAGVHGVVFPHVESRAEAELAVASMRYRPGGVRPLARGIAAPRYWGLSFEEYESRAEVWPLDPRGELVNLLLIEDQIGVANARDIVATRGASIVIPGPGDLRRAYEGDGKATENAIQTVLAACQEHDVPCGITAGPEDIQERLREGFRVIIVTDDAALAVGRRASGRS